MDADQPPYVVERQPARYSEARLQRRIDRPAIEHAVGHLLADADPTNPDTNAFDQKALEAELDYVVHSLAARTTLAENYVGLPFAD